MFLELEGSHSEQFEALDLISQLVFYFKGSIRPKYVCVSTSEEDKNQVNTVAAGGGSKYVLNVATGAVEFNPTAAADMKNVKYQGATTFGEGNQIDHGMQK